MYKKLNKKGAGYSFQSLPSVALTFLLIALFFSITLVIFSSLRSNSAVTTAANTALGNIVTAVSEIPNNWMLLIAVIIAAAIIIGIVLSSIGGLGGGGRQ
jgi:hypothetical protein